MKQDYYAQMFGAGFFVLAFKCKIFGTETLDSGMFLGQYIKERGAATKHFFQYFNINLQKRN